LTIVPSINAILEAKIVAASIHGPAFAEHGPPAVPDVIDISSHGVFMKVLPGKFAIPGRPRQIREFPLARKIAGTQTGPVHYHARSGKSKQTYDWKRLEGRRR
jgi:hypothetical protein